MENTGRESLPTGDISITVDDVLRFYQATGASSNCHVCGGDALEYMPARYREYFAIDGHHISGFAAPVPNIPVIVLNCPKCFALRMHAAVPLKKWLQDNPATI